MPGANRFPGPLSSPPSPVSARGKAVLTYYQNWEGGTPPVFLPVQVTLLWQDDTLLRIEGQRLSGTITSSSEEETLSAATVLVRFLAGVTEGGFVCSRIDEMNAGYLIVSGTTRPVELTPVWRITTDSGAYYVDAITESSPHPKIDKCPILTICCPDLDTSSLSRLVPTWFHTWMSTTSSPL